tara:strand:+ start:1270 stop:1767 length:498 start_codon:yes stop_codon:yes gene_type:complete
MMVRFGRSSLHFNDPTGDFEQESYNLEEAITSLIRGAKEYVHLVSFSLPTYNQNWYLYPAIEYAVSNGARLTVHANNHTEVKRLIGRHRNRGARGWAYTNPEGGIFHIKAIMVDGRKLYLGSANLSENAISESSEWGIISESPDICRQLESYLRHLENREYFREV